MWKPGDPRLGDLLESSFSQDSRSCRVGILGYPCDDGVKLNSGRVGAKCGPQVIRKKLPKLGPLVNPEFNIDLRKLSLFDMGDIAVTDSLVLTHKNLTKSVEDLLQQHNVGIVIGGGNDQSYCNARGLMNAINSGCIGVVNIDAHFDVRPLLNDKYAHSGSPFRQLLEDEQFKGNGTFAEFASQGNQCSADHAQYVLDNGGKIIWLSDIRKVGAKSSFQSVLQSFQGKDTFISFDIDSIQGADCPGVSCPSVIGLTAQEALDICFMAGQHNQTRLLDLSEYNPAIEEDRTARLVVNMIYYFLMGVAARC